MFKTIWNKKAIILFIILLIVTFPVAAKRPAQMTTKAILTEITVDKSGDEYIVSGIMLDIGGESKNVSAVADNVEECLAKISKIQEKKVSLAHCTNIILGEGLIDERVDKMLEYFLYLPELQNTCALSWVEKGKKATIEQFFKDTIDGKKAIIAKGALQEAVFEGGKFTYIVDIIISA